MRRKLSIFVIASFLAGYALLTIGCSTGDSLEHDDGDTSVNFNLDEPNLQERLGKDDGYAFAIFYGSDIHGSLETCG